MGGRELHNLKEISRPLAIANWLVGAGVLEYPTGRPRYLFSFLYSMSCLAAYFMALNFSLQRLKLFYATRVSEAGRLTYKALLYANVLLTLSVIAFGWIRRKGVNSYSRRLGASDDLMEKIGIPKNYRKILIRQIIHLVAVIVLLLIVIAVNSTWILNAEVAGNIKLSLGVSLFYPVTLMYIADVSFINWVWYLKTKFKQLNVFLSSISTTDLQLPRHRNVLKWNDTIINEFPSGIADQSKTNDSYNMIKIARQVHLELVRISHDVNRAYGIQILLSLAASFSLIIGLFYNAYVVAIRMQVPLHVLNQELMTTACWSLFYGSKIAAISHICALTSSEATRTGDIICELHEPCTSKQFQMEIKEFLLQLIENRLDFTACGYFTLDYGLIRTVIGSITTYLVIFIQIGDIALSEKSL
ncbi:putative gustatory receptor 28b, partial [Orussus abietinus]|uniref:putative gustatory receptor 28b n=1 Tax=Orussus abietinus TaxID=222816 RepID=UPI0006257E31